MGIHSINPSIINPSIRRNVWIARTEIVPRDEPSVAVNAMRPAAPEGRRRSIVICTARPDELRAGGRERGRPAGRGAVSRDKCTSGEHPVGLFADRTRKKLLAGETPITD